MKKEKIKNSSIIGYSGTIGKTLCDKVNFTCRYNSKNIEKIRNKKFELIVCAGAPGSMANANRNPKSDLRSINKLIKYLKQTDATQFVLISTIQVYTNIKKKNNENSIELNNQKTYGKNRKKLEKFCIQNFKNCRIIRLPSIFGPHIKKNFIFDIKNPLPTFLTFDKYNFIVSQIPKALSAMSKVYFFNKTDNIFYLNRKKITNKQSKNLIKLLKKKNYLATSFVNPNSSYQYYNLDNLWNDVKISLNNSIETLNLSVEPLLAKKIYKTLTRKKMKINNSILYKANMITLYSQYWGKKNNYIYDKKYTLNKIKLLYKKI